jgi:hypothetical protein
MNWRRGFFAGYSWAAAELAQAIRVRNAIRMRGAMYLEAANCK